MVVFLSDTLSGEHEGVRADHFFIYKLNLVVCFTMEVACQVI